MAGFLPAVLASFSAVLVPANEGSASSESDAWRYTVDVLVRGSAFGYEPSLMFSEDSPNAASARDVSPLLAEFRGHMHVRSRFLDLDFQPYTWVPRAGIYVTVAGIEWHVLLPVGDRLRFGYYHHSSHNFSDGTYGRGISMNAFEVAVDPLSGEQELFGSVLRYRLRGFGQVYLPGGVGSAHEFTGGFAFQPSAAGRTTWRAGVDLQATHDVFRGACLASTASDRVVPASMRAECRAMVSPGSRFLGSFGEHVYAGPFLSARMNFVRQSEFGAPELVGGIALDLVAAENGL